MSQKEDMKANAIEIQKGLKKLGDNRAVALSVHKTKDLIRELEARVAKLVEQLGAAG